MTLGSGGRSSCTTSGRGRQGAELVVMLEHEESLATLRRLEARASTTVNIAGDTGTVDTAAALTLHRYTALMTLTLTAARLMFSHVSFPPSTSPSQHSLLITCSRQPRRGPQSPVLVLLLCHHLITSCACADICQYANCETSQTNSRLLKLFCFTPKLRLT